MKWTVVLPMVKFDPDINCQDKYSEQVWGKNGSKLWPLGCTQDFSKIWPCDLDFDPNPIIFDLNRDIMKTNFLGKLKKIWVTTVTARFYKILLNFDPNIGLIWV